MAFNYLKVRPGQRASATWANTIVDILNMLYGGFRQSIKYSDLQHLGYDIIPDVDNLRDLGDPERAWRDIYAHYGYFLDNCFVQGRRVLKDGDPINLYDIFEPAQEKLRTIITTAVDNAKITGYTKDIRDKVLSIRMDVYGNVGVIIAEPIDAYGRVKTSTEEAFRPVTARGSVSASENAYGYELSLYTGGRPNINVFYSVGGAATIYVEVSIDGEVWRVLDTITLSAAGSGIKTYTGIAYPYVRVRTPSTGIDVEFEIAASR